MCPSRARACGRATQALTDQTVKIHAMSRGTYGATPVHAELGLGRGVRCGRKRVARLMRTAALHGIYRRRGKRARPAPAVHDDLVRRRFVADAPNRLWVTDITEHPTREGNGYCASVLDVYSRRIVGWSITDHLRAELVVDALEMARWCRRPPAGQTAVHSDRGSQGGFKWSSQHLEVRSCDGKATGVGGEGDRKAADAVSRSSTGCTS